MTTSRDIRRELGHPVLDVDGHVIEFMPAILPYLREALGPTLFEPLRQPAVADRQDPRRRHGDPARARARRSRRGGARRPSNTRDLATGAIPGLLYERFDELGIDFSVLYPTKGFGIAGIDDEDLRVGVCRGFNEFYADTYAQYSDRMTAAGVVPMHTPEEAVAELEHCKALGLKAIGFPEGVTRPIPKPELDNPTPFLFPGQTHWFDWFGIDSAVRLRPGVGQGRGARLRRRLFHGGLGNMPSGSFTSTTNYTFNHIGSFAQRMHHCASRCSWAA